MSLRFFIFILSFLFSIKAFAILHVVAAENMYGDIAQTLGGNQVSVTSILNNPNQDPHLFSADPKTIQALHRADLIIINGADYDPWAENFAKNTQAQIINVAQLNQVQTGANPHLWYNLHYTQIFAQALTSAFSQKMPAQKKYFEQNLHVFLNNMQALQATLTQDKTQVQGKSITATEPVAGYLAQALGLTMRNTHFQLSVMNDTEPSAQDRAAMIDDLQQHRVALLIYNQQVTDPTTDAIKRIALASHIPIVGVTELMPSQLHYLAWYQQTLAQVMQPLK